MELPKNITQIGESDRSCKIYAEDYVISYMKQLNVPAQDKDMAVALYGIRKEENEISYIFLYGACKLNFLQRESRHLSQAQQQEIEKLRKKYFAEYEFMGYRLLNGEMVDGFHICENGTCRYVNGYAQFYEKNDSMLAYMIDTREEEPPVEAFQQEKYDMVKQRQEERRDKMAENLKTRKEKPRPGEEQIPINMKRFRFSAVAVFAVLCIVGLAAINGSEKVEDLQVAARQIIDDMSSQKLPDDLEAVNATVQVDMIVAEDNLTDAIQKENENAAGTSAEGTSAEETSAEGLAQSQLPTEPQTPETSEAAGQDQMSQGQEGAVNETTAPTDTAADTMPETSESAPESTQTSGPVGYVIQAGDTLIGISIRQYGSESRVSDICMLNQIDNPDDIKVGQKILLP